MSPSRAIRSVVEAMYPLAHVYSQKRGDAVIVELRCVPEGSVYCHECIRITRESRACAERAAKTAEAAGDTVRARCIRETAAEWRAA